MGFEGGRLEWARRRGALALWVVGAAVFAGGVGAVAAPAQDEISAQRIAAHVRRLASDDFGGRAAGTEGGRRAARYIVDRLREAGVAAYGDPDPEAPERRRYTQAFTFTAGVEAGEDCALALGLADGLRRLALDTDYRPLGFSANGEAQGELVFVGYGISAPGRGWDDYAGIDVKGRIVLVLDGLPAGGGKESPLGQALVRYGQVRYKAMNAREHGAAGMIVIAREAVEGGGDPELVSLSRRASQGDAGIVCVDLRRSIASGWRVLGEDGQPGETIAERARAIDRDGKPGAALVDGVSVRMRVSLVKEKRESANIIARLEGADPVLRDEVIVVGAHYDHLGDGSIGGSLADKPGIHHGADDNASGCAAVLELARTLAAAKVRPRRSVLFIFFSAEELGLLGSAYYVKHPVVALERTVAPDPAYVRLVARERTLKLPERPPAAPKPCAHLWRGRLPAGLRPGVHRLQVRTTDMWGRRFESYRLFRVR